MISAQNLTKVYGLPEQSSRRILDGGGGVNGIRSAGGFVAVDNLSFEVKSGETFVIMGLSGSGKSTTIRMLNRLIEPTAGSVLVDGAEVRKLDDHGLRNLRNRKINMVFQHFALLPHRTVLENVAFGLKVRGVSTADRRDKARHTLGLVGLGDRLDDYPSSLSGGMQQRVGLARALATESEIILMDEPFSALDPLIRKEMQNLLIGLQKETQKTVVFVTHDLNEAMRIGDQIMVMKDGRKVQLGTGPDLLNDPKNEYVSRFIADVDRSKVLRARDVMRQPELSIPANASPGIALQSLRSSRVDSAFVLDDLGHLVGAVSIDSLTADAAHNSLSIGNCITQNYDRVPHDEIVSELFPMAGRHPLPIAVIDQDQRFLGVVARSALLNAMVSPTKEAVENASRTNR